MTSRTESTIRLETTALSDTEKMKCPNAIHKDDEWQTVADKRYSNCGECGGTANSPNEVPAPFKATFEVDANGTLHIDCPAGSLDGHAAAKLAALIVEFTGNGVIR